MGHIDNGRVLKTYVKYPGKGKEEAVFGNIEIFRKCFDGGPMLGARTTNEFAGIYLGGTYALGSKFEADSGLRINIENSGGIVELRQFAEDVVIFRIVPTNPAAKYACNFMATGGLPQEPFPAESQGLCAIGYFWETNWATQGGAK